MWECKLKLLGPVAPLTAPSSRRCLGSRDLRKASCKRLTSGFLQFLALFSAFLVLSLRECALCKFGQQEKHGRATKFCKDCDKVGFSVLSTIKESRNIKTLLELYYLTLVIWMCPSNYQKVFAWRATISVPMWSFLPSLSRFVKKNTLCRVNPNRSTAAPMTGTRSDYIGDERCIDMLLTVRSGKKIFR